MTAPSPQNPPLQALADSIFQVQHQPLLRAFLDNSSEGLGIVDPKGHPLYMNVRVQQILGIGLADARPEEWSERYGVFYPDSETLFPSEKLPLYRALQGEQAADQEIFVRNAIIPEGRHFLARAWPVRDGEGQLLGAILILRDTEIERRAEAERRRTEQRFQRIVEAAQEGLWTLDAQSRTTYVNRHAAGMLGYSPEEMVGRHVLEFVDPADHGQALQAIERQQRQGLNSLLDDFKFVRKDGTFLWTKVSACPVHDDSNGQYTGSLAIVVDITRRREAEEQVRRLNAELERRIAERTAQLEFSNRELEAFAYSVAHDLRAPLRSISSFSLALTEDCAGQLDATGQQYLQRIRASAHRMAELIDGILALSRVNRAELVVKDVPLSDMARSISEQIQRWKPGRTVNFRIQEGLVARGDAQLLLLVLENLMGNAWKFTRDTPVAEIEFGTLPRTGKGHIYFVRDNGAGFDMEYQKKLFGVFQRLHTQQEFEGHGVGLATVQRIIRRHAGRVWGEGRVGEGATFYFTLHEESVS
ncbi:MAG TPA: PAS domain S-box protein [Archangium sp.]|uniref:sensor histidine kinase n=1 Tax=Archangium sp. TaxID=1872627 RepID=UPI002E32B2FD|nr:PAS domain S-box protein [Archangium sp.]HEX5744753.1 PAS domain S-box protein [Archangium sp.]